MEINYFTQEYKKIMKKNFLKIPKDYICYINKEIYWIYIIRNYINDKIYICLHIV